MATIPLCVHTTFSPAPTLYPSSRSFSTLIHASTWRRSRRRGSRYLTRMNAAEKSGVTQYRIDKNNANEALGNLGKQLQALSEKQNVPPKKKASDLSSAAASSLGKYILCQRCIIERYLEIRDTIQLTPYQLNMMKSTAFGNLIEMPKLQVDMTLLEEIIMRYRGDGSFEIAPGIIATLTVQDVGRILGIPASGTEIVRVKRSKIVNHVLRELFGKDVETVTCKGGKERRHLLESKTLGTIWEKLANGGKEEDATNMVRAWMLHLLSIFLVPETGYYAKKYLLHYLLDVEKTRTMNWAKLVHSKLLEDMGHLQAEIEKIRSGEKHPRALYAKGCVMCLIVWILELTKIATPRFPDSKPRIKKWASPIKMRKNLSDVDPSKVSNHIIYEKSEHWEALWDQEEEIPPYLASRTINLHRQQENPFYNMVKKHVAYIGSENQTADKEIFERIKFLEIY